MNPAVSSPPLSGAAAAESADMLKCRRALREPASQGLRGPTFAAKNEDCARTVPLKAGIALGLFGSIMRSPVDIAAESRQSIVLSQTRAPPGRWTAPRWIAVCHCGI
jgi:hypothetical protein